MNISDISMRLAGIGRPTGSMDPKAYVLQRFSSVEREEVSHI